MKKYRPSNGTEGDWFTSNHCDHCMNENPDPDSKPKCDILSRTMIFDLHESEYPAEWCYNDQNQPTCTAYKKWDWGTMGDPLDRDNPNYIQPRDLNQLQFPFGIV